MPSLARLAISGFEKVFIAVSEVTFCYKTMTPSASTKAPRGNEATPTAARAG